jgi:excisionase family DNA binding protein
MASGQVSVAEAAEMLGVHPQRIHQRIREGSLEAEKIGNQWSIRKDALLRVAHHAGPGRPLSAKSAWDLLSVAALDEDAAEKLSPPARSRARARLRNLLAHSSDADLDDIALLLSRALRNRASRALYAASPRDLPDIRVDRRVRLSGVSLPESSMAAGDVVEGYVAAADAEALVEDYLLVPASRSQANVILHVVAADADGPADDNEPWIDDVWSPLVIAVDLAEHDGVREKGEAAKALDNLRAHLRASDV